MLEGLENLGKDFIEINEGNEEKVQPTQVEVIAEDNLKPNTISSSVSVEDNKQLEHYDVTPVFSTMICQLGVFTGIWFLLKYVLGKIIHLNKELVISSFVPNIELGDNILIIVRSIDDFINTSINCILSDNGINKGAVTSLTIIGAIALVSIVVTHLAFRSTGNKFVSLAQLFITLIFIVISGYTLFNYGKESIYLMNDAELSNYFNEMSEDELQDLAMRSCGVNIQIRSDGTVHGIYKVNKEKLLATLIDGSSNWGVDFELPKQVTILDSTFTLKSVSETEFIYELPEVSYDEE